MAFTPWSDVASATLLNFPERDAVALNLNSLLSPGASVPALNTTLLRPSLVKPSGNVSVTFTLVSVLLPAFLTTSVTGTGSQMFTSAGSVFVN